MRPIDADALRIIKVEECEGYTIDYYAAGWKACINWIKTLPTLDVMSVKRGRWITEGGDIICPVCGAAYDEEILWMYRDESDQDCGLSYCPHCAAKLER